MSVINTNITSMIGQQNLRESQNSLQTSMERLSSGLRINSAKDDAAGQAIANRMTAQITGLSTAQRNSNDGISVAQTAEGGLDQINDNLQRIRELSVQAQNGTNSENDLTSIQDEIGQRLNEIDRISKETDFNGTKVLSESAAQLNIQVGANDGESISVNLKTMNATSLNVSDFSVSGAKAATESDLQGIENLQEIETVDGVTKYGKTTNPEATLANVINDDVLTSGTDATNSAHVAVSGGETYRYNAKDSFVLEKNDQASGDVASNLTPATGLNEVTIDLEDTGQNIDVRIDSDGNLTNAAGEALKTTGTAGADFALAVAEEGDTQATITNITDYVATNTTTVASKITDGDTVFAGEGGEASIDQTTTFTRDQLLAEIDGEQVTVTDDASSANGPTNTYDISASGDVSQSGSTVYLDVSAAITTLTTDEEGFTEEYFVQEDGTVNSQQDGNGDTVYFEDEVLTTDPETKATANPLEALDSALNQVDSLRSELGAVQNRFESAITNLSTNETNLSAARSRIEDADYAMEVADMTKNQILQQAGTSVLAQANQLPQNVLSLLG